MPASANDGSATDEARRFVSGLSAELASGAVELPAMPEVARRLSHALDDVRVTTETLEAIVASEPVLAGRVVMLASSAALNSSADPIRNLGEALRRIGSGMLRVVTLAYALSRVRVDTHDPQLSARLHEIWSRSMRVAALCQVVARRVGGVNPEVAMFAGLIHGIGEIGILTRLSKYPTLIDAERSRAVIGEWSGHVSRAILENWGIDPEITEAVAGRTDCRLEAHGPIGLTEVLAIGVELAQRAAEPGSLEPSTLDPDILRRVLGCEQACQDVMTAAQSQVDLMRGMLGA